MTNEASGASRPKQRTGIVVKQPGGRLGHIQRIPDRPSTGAGATMGPRRVRAKSGTAARSHQDERPGQRVYREGAPGELIEQRCGCCAEVQVCTGRAAILAAINALFGRHQRPLRSPGMSASNVRFGRLVNVRFGRRECPLQPSPRSRSISRRSLLVGRPAPRSRCGRPRAGSTGRAGVRSVKHCAAASAPTRLAISRRTSRIRS